MEREKLAEVREWFKKGSDDLRAAEADRTASPPLVEDALFHCQQAAEKAMKGFLAAHDRIFRKTHDLDELAVACEAVDPSLADALGPARDLTVFAWVFRYPGQTETPTGAEARKAVATARAAVEALRSRLPQGGQDIP